MNLTKMFFLTILSSALWAQVSLGDDGIIKIKNMAGYTVKRVNCWDSRGKKTHNTGHLNLGARRTCHRSSYLKITGILFGGPNADYTRRFRRSSLNCVGSQKMLCITLRGTTVTPRASTSCHNVQDATACN